jgi:hypothetical protein
VRELPQAGTHPSRYLFLHSDEAIANLRAEGIADERMHFVGNTMIDSLVAMEERFRNANAAAALGLTAGDYLLVTLHRPADRKLIACALQGASPLCITRPRVEKGGRFGAHPRDPRRERCPWGRDVRAPPPSHMQAPDSLTRPHPSPTPGGNHSVVQVSRSPRRTLGGSSANRRFAASRPSR